MVKILLRPQKVAKNCLMLSKVRFCGKWKDSKAQTTVVFVPRVIYLSFGKRDKDINLQEKKKDIQENCKQ